MQISDLVGQYNYAVSAGAEKVTGTKGVENLVSSLKSLTKGNIFEGTVSSMKNGKVTLALSNGTQLSARLDGKVALSEGQPMFFQVKSNDGSTISIRPFVVDGNGVNYTLMQALSAAGLPAESNYLSMVNKMMEEQMPIDRSSLQQMARLANANGSIDVRTLVQMSKLGIEITPENAAQFENYLGDKQAITAAIDSLIDELPMAMQGSSLSEEALRQMNSQVLSVITEGTGPVPEGVPAVAGEGFFQAAGASQAAAAGMETPASATPAAESPVAESSVAASPAEGENLLLQAAAATAEGVEFIMAEENPQMSVTQEAGDTAQNAAMAETPDAQNAAETANAQNATAEHTNAANPQNAPAAETPNAQNAAAENTNAANTHNAQEAEIPNAQAAAKNADAQNNPDVTAARTLNAQNAEVEHTNAANSQNASAAEPANAQNAGVKAESPGTQNASAAADGAHAQNAAAAEPAPHTLAAVLNDRQMDHLNTMLKGLVGQEHLHYDGTKNVNALLNDLRGLLDSKFPIDREPLNRLLSSKEFKALVKDGLEQQWTIRPEELTGSDKINKLYEKLDRQMDRIGQVLRATGQENANFTQTAADIRSNVEFMNQINQAYTYVQIPLKMSGQTASGELYVYTNRKSLMEGDKELTAFLHLDMDNLGPTDISVKLLRREVSTNFYLENDAAYDLIEQHLPILEERLKSKGYNCKVSVINESRHVNFVEDFLKKDQPSAGQLHRYSFDMRA